MSCATVLKGKVARISLFIAMLQLLERRPGTSRLVGLDIDEDLLQVKSRSDLILCFKIMNFTNDMVKICRQKLKLVVLEVFFFKFNDDIYGTGYGYPGVEISKNINLKFNTICGYGNYDDKKVIDYNRYALPMNLLIRLNPNIQSGVFLRSDF